MYFYNQCRHSDTIIIQKCTSTSGSLVLPSQRTLPRPFTSIHIYHSSTLFPVLFRYMWPQLPLHNSRPGLVALWSWGLVGEQHGQSGSHVLQLSVTSSVYSMDGRHQEICAVRAHSSTSLLQPLNRWTPLIRDERASVRWTLVAKRVLALELGTSASSSDCAHYWKWVYPWR